MLHSTDFDLTKVTISMSDIQVGARVRFLNTTGGGLITRIMRDGVIYVKDESGFEIPVLRNEIVVVSEGSTIAPAPQKHQSVSDALNTGVVRPTTAPSVPVEHRKREADPAREKINAYLCYLPAEPEMLGHTSFEVYLVNDSNYDLQVLYLSGRDDSREVRFQGVVPFDSSELLESFVPSVLDQRLHTTLYITPFKGDGAFLPKPASRVELRVEGNRFFRANAFKPNDFFEDGAIIFDIITDDVPFSRQNIDTKELAQQMQEKKRTDERPKRKVEPAQPKRDEPLVIDLHIENIIDTTLGMSNKDILDLQLAEVEKVMQKYRKPQDKGKEIIFIHGKGEGVLRQAVCDLLKRKYPRAEQRDASFQEYGFGATKVTVR